ncbi:MAG TPA: hypothetical protein DCX14_01805 [Flavobacteriales bacterium]|nr:hypothetical protein [Flavobacteriales bacterium]
MADQAYWADFWTAKAQSETDFQATGRGTMDTIGFLYTVRECAKSLKLSEDDDLLDVGGGTGLIALAVSPFVNSVLTIDLSSGISERAKKNLADCDNVRAQMGSITRIPSPDSFFSKVLAYSVLQYLSDDEVVFAAIREVGRVMKPGAVALLAGNPDPDCFQGYIDKQCGENSEARQKEIVFQKDLRWIPRDKAIAMAADCGLNAVAVDIHERIWQSFYMYDLVLEKPL